MKLSITQKLFGAFIGLTLLVLCATLGLARWSFDYGFLNYIHAQEKQRLQTALPDLIDSYINANNSWSDIDEKIFKEFINQAKRAAGLPPAHPPKAHYSSASPSRHKMPPPPPNALYDALGRLVAGNAHRPDVSSSVCIDIQVQERSVGTLCSTLLKQFPSSLDAVFSRQQANSMLLIGIISLLLACAVSFFLSRGLLAPIKRMIDGVTKLSNGDYSHRMHELRADELGQLTRGLDRLGSTLAQNQTARKRLLADLSHELRTPISILSAEIEALKDGLRAFDHTQLNSFDQEVQRLRHLIEDLYELALADVGGLHYEFAALDLKVPIARAVARMQKLAAPMTITFSSLPAHKPVYVLADVRRIDQLLQNLLSNSIAYSDQPGTIDVHISCTDTCALITIDDSPPSVPEADCDKLFAPLFRLEASRSQHTGGAGLGLAICQNVVLAHKGHISARPSYLGGLHVRVELPLLDHPL